MKEKSKKKIMCINIKNKKHQQYPNDFYILNLRNIEPVSYYYRTQMSTMDLSILKHKGWQGF